MRTMRWLFVALGLGWAAPIAWAESRGDVNVELWTDRGNDAVYQPGDAMEVRVRSSDDGYLLVYEIDAEGYLRMLWPDRGSRGFVEGRQTLSVPSEHSNLELVVEAPTGQGYLVALVSREPFHDLPWYLRPYDEQAAETGYAGNPDDEDGVTREGHIVGDPFVAMERVRRRVLEDPEDPSAFGTAYSTYYVHERVRYPRYLCNDCHRPGYWAWWDGFDPYYARCSAFDFRMNWGWYWGPTYWFGYVPYYYYVARADCPPRYRLYSARNACFSSWDGWRRWQTVMGGSIRRYKSPPPVGYLPPSKYKDGGRVSRSVPPGFLVGREVAPGRHGGMLRPTVDAGRPVSRGGDGERVERPRAVGRGGIAGRTGDPGRGRGSVDDSETGRVERGIPERDRGGMRWVGRGRAEADGRVGDGGRSERERPSREEPSRLERPGLGRMPVERGRGGEDRPVLRRPEERPRDEAPRIRSNDRPRAEAPRQERRQESHRAPESKGERRQESRDDDRGRGGRRGR